MTEINQKLLGLILEGKTKNEILQTLNLSSKQLQIRLELLKNEGYNLAYEVTDTGKIRYLVLNNLFFEQSNTLDLKLEKHQDIFRAIVVSDLHVGHRLDCLERMNLIYNYMSREEINLIINCGDIINGCCNDEDEIVIRKQLERLIAKHPYDPNIISLVCFGNHCHSALTHYGINVSNILCTERPDFISLGFGVGLVNIKKGQIIVSHPIKDNIIKKHWGHHLTERKLILRGHGHHYVVKDKDTNYVVKIPTISNILQSENSSLPGAVKVTIELDESGQFDVLYLENLIITDKVYTAGYFKGQFYGENIYQCKESDLMNPKTKKLV